MYFFVRKIDGKVVNHSGLGLPPDGQSVLPVPLEIALKNSGFPADELLAFEVLDLNQALPLTSHPLEALVATIMDGGVVDIQVDPAWQPPPPPVDQMALLTATVAQNVASSPHDKRFLQQKEIGKQLIPWIREHPDCTPAEAEKAVAPLVIAEMPGQPVVPCLYWEYGGKPQGLAMSYLYEAIKRGYLPPETPMTWQSLVGLIVATPEEMIASWLRSL